MVETKVGHLCMSCGNVVQGKAAPLPDSPQVKPGPAAKLTAAAPIPQPLAPAVSELHGGQKVVQPLADFDPNENPFPAEAQASQPSAQPPVAAAVASPPTLEAPEKSSTGPSGRGLWIRLAATSLAALLIPIGIVYALAGLATQGCSEGFSGLGCVIVGAYAILVASFIVSIIVMWLMLKRFAIPRPFLVSLGIAFIGGILAQIFGLSGYFSIILGVVLLPFAYFLGAVIAYFLANRWLKRTVFVVLAILAISGVLYGVSRVGSSAAVKGSVTRHSEEQVQKLDFQVYLPSYLPAGYKLYGATAIDYLPSTDTYFEATYLFGSNETNDPLGYHINSFKVPSYYSPPTNCGDGLPTKKLPGRYPCSVAGTTTTGEDIYVTQIAASGDMIAYIKKDTTLVTLTTNGPMDKIVQKPDLIKIFSSLKATPVKDAVKIPSS